MQHHKHPHNGASAGGLLAETPPTHSNPTELPVQLTRDEIARKADLIYVNQGSAQGHDVEHWLAAEADSLTIPTPARSES